MVQKPVFHRQAERRTDSHGETSIPSTTSLAGGGRGGWWTSLPPQRKSPFLNRLNAFVRFSKDPSKGEGVIMTYQQYLVHQQFEYGVFILLHLLQQIDEPAQKLMSVHQALLFGIKVWFVKHIHSPSKLDKVIPMWYASAGDTKTNIDLTPHHLYLIWFLLTFLKVIRKNL